MLLRRTRIKRTKSKRNRLDPNRFDGFPLARSVRIVDKDILYAASQRGQCEVCCRPAKTCGHHLSSRGSGGDDRDENIVAVCIPCHHDIHMGLISRDRLRAIIAARAIPLGAK